MDPNITASKYVNLEYANIGDTLNYTIVIKNNGDTDAINVNLTDLIPQSANFITNSIYVNGSQNPGIDPALGIDLYTIPIGDTTTVTMQALVVNLPVNNPLLNTGQVDYQYNSSSTTTPNIVTSSIDTNTAATTISSPIIKLIKSANTTTISTGSTITYKIDFTNIGNTTANNLIFFDTIPLGTSFVTNSLVVFGTVTVPGANPSPPTGFSFGALPSNSSSFFSFQVIVNSIPSNGNISNFCDAIYDYTNNPSFPNANQGRTTSNILDIGTPFADLSGITKSVDKFYAKCGDILTYILTIPNSGNTTALNVIIIDTIPNGTTYIDGTLTLNGTTIGGNPNSITLGTIPAGYTSTISFKVKINC